MTDNPLLNPVTVGALTLRHRIVMAPMTRIRADRDTLAPTTDNTTYYSQRASEGGLIITEAVHISPEGTPIWTIYQNVRDDGGQVPGIWTGTQRDGWRDVVSAVHARKGLIVCQLLHAGRIAQPKIGIIRWRQIVICPCPRHRHRRLPCRKVTRTAIITGISRIPSHAR